MLLAERLEYVDAGDQSVTLALPPDVITVWPLARVFDLDRVRDLDTLTRKSVVDRGAHLIARFFVAFIIEHPEPRPVGDRRSVERAKQHVRGRRRQDARALRHCFADDTLDVIRHCVISHSDLDLEHRRRRRFGKIGNCFLADEIVGQDDEVASLGAKLGGAPGDFGDAPLELPNLYPVPDVERALALNGQAGECVAECVLQSEADDDRADRGSRQKFLLEDERRDDQEQPDDNGVLEDRGKAVGDPIRAQRVQQ